MEYLRISAVLLYFCTVPGTTGSQHTLHTSCMSQQSGHECVLLMLCLYKAMLFSCAGVLLTQTHPAARYVCRTGNITPQVSVWWCAGSLICGLVHWTSNNKQPIHHSRTHCPPSHHHLSGGSGGQLHQLGNRVSLCAYFQQWITTA